MRLKNIVVCAALCLLAACASMHIAVASAQTVPNATAMPFIKGQWFSSAGAPLASGKLYFYAAGTSTAEPTYTTTCSGVDLSMCTQNTQPVTLDSGGRADIYFGPVCYKIVAQNAGGVQQWTQDNLCDVALLYKTVFVSKNINNVRKCDQFTGATAGAKIAACIADLPSTGGTADASGLNGAQTINANMFNGITKPVELMLCGASYSVSAGQTVANVSGVHIHGCETQETIVALSGNINGFTFTGSTNIEVDHLKITGGLAAIVATGTSSIINIHDNFITGVNGSGAPNAGVYVENGDDVKILNNRIVGNGAGAATLGNFDIVLDYAQGYSSRVLIQGNVVGGSGSSVAINIAMFNCSYCEAVDNYVDNNNQLPSALIGGYGILSYSFTSTNNKQTTISNNRINNTGGSGIYAAGSDKIVISGNVLNNVAQQQSDALLTVGGIAIAVDPTAANNGDVAITGNTIITSGKDCIVLGSNNTSVTGNVCRFIAGAAVRIRNNITGLVIHGNTATSVAQGVLADAGVSLSSVAISGNTFKSSGITIWVTNAMAGFNNGAITGNTLESTGSHIITMAGAVGGTVSANAFSGGMADAINWTGSNVTITGNNIKNCTSNGIEVTGNDAQITGNTVTGCGSGILVTGVRATAAWNNLGGNTQPHVTFSDGTYPGPGNRLTNGATSLLQGLAVMVAGTTSITTSECLGVNEPVVASVMVDIGTIGHVQASCTGMNTLTVSSDNAADVSDVFWEIRH